MVLPSNMLRRLSMDLGKYSRAAINRGGRNLYQQKPDKNDRRHFSCAIIHKPGAAPQRSTIGLPDALLVIRSLARHCRCAGILTGWLADSCRLIIIVITLNLIPKKRKPPRLSFRLGLGFAPPATVI